MVTDTEIVTAFRRAGGVVGRQAGGCRPGCALWELRGARAFVCRGHGAVHRCGWDCDRRVSTGSDDVCMLTGHVVRGAPEEHHWHKAGPGGRVLQTHLGCRRHAESAAAGKAARMNKHVLWACRQLLLPSPPRATSRALHHRRALAVVRRAIRTAPSFASAWTATVFAAARAAPAMRPPCLSGVLVRTVAARIAQFACALGVAANKRSAAAFAAATVQMLSTGHCANGVCVIPRLPVLARHAPSELQHAELLGISCRAVSTATRTIVDACVAGGVRFPLTRWRNRRVRPPGHAAIPTANATSSASGSATALHTAAVSSIGNALSA